MQGSSYLEVHICAKSQHSAELRVIKNCAPFPNTVLASSSSDHISFPLTIAVQKKKSQTSNMENQIVEEGIFFWHKLYIWYYPILILLSNLLNLTFPHTQNWHRQATTCLSIIIVGQDS